MECGLFANKETKLSVQTSVRNKDVYVLQVMKGDPNDCVMELLMMCYALKTACCKRVIGVVPYLPYSKQSKMRNRGAIPSKMIAQLLCRAGMDHMITMDLHSKEVQGFYDCPVDNLRASPFLIQYIQERVDYTNAVIVARQPGAAQRANSFAERLRLDFAVLHGQEMEEDSDKCDGRHSPPSLRRSRSQLRNSESLCSDLVPPLGLPQKVKKQLAIVGDVKDRVAIIVEDIVDDANVLKDAARILKNGGALKVYVVATHGLFSGDAPSVIMDSQIDEVIVTNSVPLDGKMSICPKIKMVDISPILSEAVRRIHNGESMSFLFRNIPLED
jgi:ribose-phosphate pyrophosphokinase